MSVYKTTDSDAPPPPNVGARKGEGRVSDKDLQRAVRALIEDAVQFTDGELSPEREKATEYYKGEPFGNEEEGRSQVILTEVRDAVRGTLPSMLRMFFGPERQLEFVPRKAADIQIAKQATDYVQYVFSEDNAGFLRTLDVLQDGFVRKIGAFKWGWEDGCVVAHEDEDVSQERLMQLAQREEVEFTKIEAEPADDDDAPDAQPTFTVHYTVQKEGRARVWSLPPEELIFSRSAVGVDDALFIGHRTEVRRGDLVAMGYDEDEIDEHGGADSTLRNNVEAQERGASAVHERDPEAGEANETILYVEGYLLFDADGDGKLELRNVCTIGPSYHIVHDKPTDEIPFAVYTPIPEPHTLVGQSLADLTMDLQLIKSSLARGMLDSFALSIFPRTTVLEGMASIEDVLNNEIGAPIRIKRDGAVVPFNHPFTGEGAMPILTYFDGVTESRISRNKGAMGLDADALQSSTSQAVNAAVSASQEQTEMFARIFAEQTLKPLFRGIYKMLVEHQPKSRLVKLRGSFVEVNVAAWDADMDVTVNVALGTSLPEQRTQTLLGIAEKQETIITQLGPANPLCTLAQLRNTYAKIIELAGYRDPSEFFNDVPADWQPPPPAAPQKTPEQTLAEAQLQIEQMRTQKDLEIKQAELSLKAQQQKFDQALEVRRMAHDFTLRRYEIDAKNGAAYTQQQLELDARQEEAALQGVMDMHRMNHEHAVGSHERALAEEQQTHEQGLAEDAQAHEQQMAERAATAQESQAAPGMTE